MAHASLVLTVIGPDRPGLVEALSRVIADHRANWLESRMAHLAGQFAGLLRVSVAPERADALAAALEALSTTGLRVIATRAADHAPPTQPRLRLEGVGLDRPGIVRELSAALAARGVNVEELTSHTSSAPMSGETLFHVTAHLRAPDEVDALRPVLEKLADELAIEVTLERESDD
ncbi:MAG: ACT domain-containing protein [Myxococcota bacterium]